MIDHTGVPATDLARSRAFYTEALKPLGYVVMKEFGPVVGFGVPPHPDFWLAPALEKFQPAHIAFRAESRAAVDAFHAAALNAGGKDNGAPGLRPHYHATYYGAFVLDPDGHNIEAVCHSPE